MGGVSTSQKFGKALRKARQAAGLSQEELAERAGLHRTYISQLERGLKSPTLDIIDRLATSVGSTTPKLVELAFEGGNK